MEFSKQEYWSGLPCPTPGDLPEPGIELMSPAAPALQADFLPLSHWGSPRTSLDGYKVRELIGNRTAIPETLKVFFRLKKKRALAVTQSHMKKKISFVKITTYVNIKASIIGF